MKSGNNESGFSDGGSAACTSLHRKAYCFGFGISLNPFEGGIQIVLHAEVPFEKGKIEKEIISEKEKFAEGKAIELVVQLSIVSSLHKGRRLKTGKKK